MADKIDEFSAAIGSLQSDVSNVKGLVQETRDFMASINNQITGIVTDRALMKRDVETAHSRIDGVIKDINDNLRPVTEDYKDKKSFLIWLSAGIAAIGTAVINIAGVFLK